MQYIKTIQAGVNSIGEAVKLQENQSPLTGSQTLCCILPAPLQSFWGFPPAKSFSHNGIYNAS